MWESKNCNILYESPLIPLLPLPDQVTYMMSCLLFLSVWLLVYLCKVFLQADLSLLLLLDYSKVLFHPLLPFLFLHHYQGCNEDKKHDQVLCFHNHPSLLN